MRSIPQRELRNDVARVLREVQAGEHLQVTVRGEVVAELQPPRRRGLTPTTTALGLLGSATDGGALGELAAARLAAEADEREPPA